MCFNNIFKVLKFYLFIIYLCMKTSVTPLHRVVGLEYSIQRHLDRLSDICVLCTLMGILAMHVQLGFLHQTVWQCE